MNFRFGTLAPKALLGRRLPEVLGNEGVKGTQSSLAESPFGTSSILEVNPPLAPLPLLMTAHRTGTATCVELEAREFGTQRGATMLRVSAIMQRLHASSSQRELCQTVAAKLRQLTGYDRVMVYRFGREGHGEVIAEARDRDLEPYLGLHYPASDIPRQARELYLAQRVRMIADVDYTPVALLTDPALGDLPPLDMTQCALRSVSTVHLEYMRNMGTRVSLGVSLIINNSFWGLLVCHHRVPLVITPDMRVQCGLIGQLVSLLLGSLGDAEVYAEQLRRQRTLHSVVRQLANPGPVADALSSCGMDLLSLLNATGAVVRLRDRIVTAGDTPPPEAVERAAATLGGALAS
jgi:light-regulated signal transduction histidine kinase (bacteriophytochrome)